MSKCANQRLPDPWARRALAVLALLIAVFAVQALPSCAMAQTLPGPVHAAVTSERAPAVTASANSAPDSCCAAPSAMPLASGTHPQAGPVRAAATSDELLVSGSYRPLGTGCVPIHRARSALLASYCVWRI